MNLIHPVLRDKVIWNLLHGFSLRETAEECEVHKNTVARYQRIYEAKHGPIICVCGKPRRDHRGFCWARFARSKKRQAIIAAFPKREKPL